MFLGAITQIKNGTSIQNIKDWLSNNIKDDITYERLPTGFEITDNELTTLIDIYFI